MKKPVSEYTDPALLRGLMENAKRLGREDIWRDAFRQLCFLEGMNVSDPLHRGFYEMLTAYEELLTIKNGRTTKASRTRQKLKNKGVEQCLEDWAVGKTETEGFKLLVENDLVELTGEYLVLKFHDRFSEKAVESARKRLRDLGVS